MTKNQRTIVYLVIVAVALVALVIGIVWAAASWQSAVGVLPL